MKNVSATATAGEVVGKGPGRGFVHVWNKGPNTVYLRYDGDDGTEVTSSIGFPVVINTGLFLNNDGIKNPFIYDIRAICDTAQTAELAVQTDDESQ